MSLGSIVIVLLAVVLLATTAWLVLSRNANPWPSIVVAMFTSGVCFAVGGGSGEDTAGPSAATVAAAIVGVLSVAAAATALVPRSEEAGPSRIPRLLASAGIVIGAVGLVLNVLVS
jgi:drug/metabolite transporter (DMT)-like permease